MNKKIKTIAKVNINLFDSLKDEMKGCIGKKKGKEKELEINVSAKQKQLDWINTLYHEFTHIVEEVLSAENVMEIGKKKNKVLVGFDCTFRDLDKLAYKIGKDCEKCREDFLKGK